MSISTSNSRSISKLGGSLAVNVAWLLSATLAVPAWSQNERGVAQLEEIAVTARKREESIQDAPLTIQAFTAEQIEERGAQSLADLAKFTPGLTFNQGSSRAASDFSIRGMTQISPVGDNRQDLVTMFIDGVPYIGNPSASAPRISRASRSSRGRSRRCSAARPSAARSA